MPRKRKKKSRAVPLLFGLFAALFVVQLIQLHKMRERLAFIDSLQENNAQVVEEVNLAKAYLTDFGVDLNQIREFLLLPTADYDFGDALEFLNDEEPEVSSVVMDFVQRLSTYEQDVRRHDDNVAAIRDWVVQEELLPNGMSWASTHGDYADGLLSFVALNANGVSTFSLHVDDQGYVWVDSYDHRFTWEEESSFVDIEDEVLDFVEDDLEEVLARIDEVNAQRSYVADTLLVDESVLLALEEMGLNLSLEQEGEEQFSRRLSNVEGDSVGSLRVWKGSGELQLFISRPTEGLQDEEEITLASDEGGILVLEQALREWVDTRTQLDILIDTQRREMEDLLDSRSFQSALKEAGLSMGTVVETETRIEYPILKQGELLRTLFIDKTDGELYSETPENSPQTLSAILEAGFDKKKLPNSWPPFLSTTS